MKPALCALALAACAHAPVVALRPDPSPPAGSTVETFEARDGTQLLARVWPATAAAQRGVVVIVHGLKDHSARYATTATRLASAGYAVYAFDLRGHGRSAGPRVAPDRWIDYVDDLERFLTKIVEPREAGRPLFLLGHSMGGAIATLAAERHARKLAGLILSAPAVALEAPPLLLAGIAMIGAVAPSQPALELPNASFSSDPAAADVLAKDPLISQPNAPARTAAGLTDGIRQLWEELDALTMPIFAMHGTADLLTAPAGSRLLIHHAPATDKTLRIYDQYAHDLLHEPDTLGKQVEDDVVAWLDAHTGGAAITPPSVVDYPLAGDPRGRAQAIESGAGVAISNRDGTNAYGFSGSLAVNLARRRPIGFHLALVGRFVGDFRTVSLRPLGVAVRAGAAVLGISAGAAFITGKEFAASGGAWLELPVGPAHLSGSAEWSPRFDGDGQLLWTSV